MSDVTPDDSVQFGTDLEVSGDGAQVDLEPRLALWAMWATGGKVVTLASAFLVNVLLARILTPEVLGAYFFVLSISILCASMAQLGLKQAVVKISSEAVADGDFGRAKGAIGGALLVGFLGSLPVAIVVTMLGSFLFGEVLGFSVAPPVIWLLGPLIIFLTARELVGESFRGLQRLEWATLSGEGSNTVIQAVALLLLTLWGVTLSLGSVLALYAACLAVVIAVGGLKLLRTMSPIKSSTMPLRQLLGVGVPLMAGTLVAVGLAEAGTVVLGAVADPGDVALYGAAVRVAGLLAMPLLVVNAVIAPLIGPLKAKDDVRRLERLVRGSATISGSISAAGCLLLVAFGQQILGLVYGGFYGGAYWVLVTLSIAQLFNVASGPCGLILAMTGNQVTMLRMTLLGFFAVLFGVLLLTPLLGALGTAIGVCIGLIVQNSALIVAVRTHIGIKGHADITFRDARYLLRGERT